MRVLLDTNQIIRREDSRNVPTTLRQLLGDLAKGGVKVVVHPESLAELSGDRNRVRRRRIKSKTGTYPVLMNPPIPPESFVQAAGGVNRRNDAVDIALLYAVRNGLATILVTEDRGLIGRAIRVGLQDVVLNPTDALDYFRDLLGRQVLVPPTVARWTQAFQLDQSDPFFATLRADYFGFNRWWKEKVVPQGRWCLAVTGEDNRIRALLVVHLQTGTLLSSPPRERLKICTFKVDSEVSGFRFGELMLNAALQFSVSRSIDEVFVTVLPKYDDLVQFFRHFGFSEIGRDHGELVMLKKIPETGAFINSGGLESIQESFPRAPGRADIRRFIVPIRPEYHRVLFPEFGLGRSEVTPPIPPVLSSAAGNAVRKAYLSRSRTELVRSGDLLYFFRSWDLHRVTHLGVVEAVKRLHRVVDVLNFVGNRTVLKRDEVREFCRRGPVLCVLFWSLGEIPHQFTADELREARIGVPLSIRQVRTDRWTRLEAS